MPLIHFSFCLLIAKVTLLKYLNIPAAVAAATFKDAHQAPEATSSGISHMYIHKVGLMQCALQDALKASPMSASEVERLKNRDNLLGSEDP